jgi:hypothetical protein
VRKIVIIISALALALTACSDGGSSCSAIVDDGMDLFQDVIDSLDGKALDEIQDDPFTTADYEERVADLEQRTTDAGCTDEEMTSLFEEKIGTLEAGDSNPGGQFFISILTSAVEQGEFDFSG